MKFFSLKREKTPNKQKNKKKKTTKWYSKTYQYRNSIISSFPHERKWICPGISVTSCSNSPLHRQQISHNPLSKGVLWKHPFNWEECLQTSTHKAFWSENKKNLTLPCGGTLEGQLHSRLHWRAMQSFLQDTWNEETFYSSLLSFDNHHEPR